MASLLACSESIYHGPRSTSKLQELRVGSSVRKAELRQPLTYLVFYWVDIDAWIWVVRRTSDISCMPRNTRFKCVEASNFSEVGGKQWQCALSRAGLAFPLLEHDIARKIACRSLFDGWFQAVFSPSVENCNTFPPRWHLRFSLWICIMLHLYLVWPYWKLSLLYP